MTRSQYEAVPTRVVSQGPTAVEAATVPPLVPISTVELSIQEANLCLYQMLAASVVVTEENSTS